MAKVMIVDDSKTARFRLRRMIREWGHDVLTARNGEEALELARSEQPQIILMDIVMPGMNGYQAKRTLARDPDTQHIPVIFVSSRDEETDRVWGMRQGAVDYVTKPVKPEDLFNAISNAVAA
ncbi:MAG: response regulator [Xanthomonadales bacterium]|nr:response regulator [Xanthomonadales bacterium]NIX12771.1 response regulator [Xanthomonadales bacterium]